jgi:hypothetical protein
MRAGQVAEPLTVGQLAARAAVRTDTIRSRPEVDLSGLVQGTALLSQPSFQPGQGRV